MKLRSWSLTFPWDPFVFLWKDGVLTETSWMDPSTHSWVPSVIWLCFFRCHFAPKRNLLYDSLCFTFNTTRFLPRWDHKTWSHNLWIGSPRNFWRAIWQGLQHHVFNHALFAGATKVNDLHQSGRSEIHAPDFFGRVSLFFLFPQFYMSNIVKWRWSPHFHFNFNWLFLRGRVLR